MDGFQEYSPNIDANAACTHNDCTIRLLDVLDHNSCEVNFTGNSEQDGLSFTKNQSEIHVIDMHFLNSGEGLFVTISCNT